MKTLKQPSSRAQVERKNIKTILALFKDYLFPIYCLDCGVEGEWLCENCFKKIPLVGVFCCPVCHQETDLGVCCSACVGLSQLDQHLAILTYSEDTLIGKIIHNLKYNFAEDLAVILDKIIRDFLQNNKIKADYLISVPLHKKRQAERGFNQAEIIARLLSQATSIPLLNNLTRSRYTQQQAKLDREKRIKNTKDAFVCAGSVSGKILLVDDVFTTGSTLQECAKVLRQAGAMEVVGFSLARG